ncbi:hypothetical protein MNB_SV-6-427 [hydrothermal vent metagenome]|uniref:Lipoprotein n=1 Tax=hydrothermal vent metagenome TaxID=652676 RepID=A0A1W1B9I6_9ZZZZ
MKKILILSSLIVASTLFIGCGGGGGGGGGGGVAPVPPPEPEPFSMLYLDNIDGVGMAGVPYYCPSGDGFTDENGGFLFYDGENCSFDLTGFNGSIVYDDYLFIDYNDGSGVDGLGYDCISGTSGFTDINGNFDYDIDDECTFYL